MTAAAGQLSSGCSALHFCVPFAVSHKGSATLKPNNSEMVPRGGAAAGETRSALLAGGQNPFLGTVTAPWWGRNSVCYGKSLIQTIQGGNGQDQSSAFKTIFILCNLKLSENL